MESKKRRLHGPLGFVAQGNFGLVCRLQISLYDLKQSPQTWFWKFSHIVLDFGRKQSEEDHSMFHFHTSTEKWIYLIVYVDDTDYRK